VPGLSFVVVDRRHLQTCRGQARSLSLDLVAQLHGFETDGQFRFTPPTHVVLALAQALVELDRGLYAREFAIYPGKLTTADTFRVGSIGQLFEDDMVALAAAAHEVLNEMGIELERA